MKENTLEIKYQIISINDLTDKDKYLVNSAKQAMVNSYSPYSKFRVGASVLLSNGLIIQGSNQENVAYPSGLCAERVSIFAAQSTYPKEKIMALAIVSENQKGENVETFPCGSCLQVAAEYEAKQRQKIRIIVQKNSNEVYVFDSVKCLLPFGFEF